MFVEALCQVYCGNLDRYVELTGEVVRRYGGGRGLRPRVLRRRAAVGRPPRRGAGAAPTIPWPPHGGSATRTGLPTHGVDRRDGVLTGRTPGGRWAAWEEGVAFVREHRVQFFEGFLARDAARLHPTDGKPDVALGLFAQAIDAFHRAGNVPQLVPSPWRASPRCSSGSTGSSPPPCSPARYPATVELHHVPELAELAVGSPLGWERPG